MGESYGRVDLVHVNFSNLVITVATDYSASPEV